MKRWIRTLAQIAQRLVDRLSPRRHCGGFVLEERDGFDYIVPRKP